MNRDVECFADFVQYYQSKFVLSRTDPKKMYAIGGWVDRAEGRESCSASVYVSGKQEGATIAMTQAKAWEDVAFGLPEIGMTTFFRHELVYLYYRTQRNGGRGYGLDRVLYHSFNGFAARQNGLPTITKDQLGSAAMAWQVLKPRYLGLDVAWKDFTSKSPKRLAYALTHHFGTYLSAREYPALCYKMYEIGTVLGPTKVRLPEKYKEYKELIQRTFNPDMEVEIV